jgi:hypothetical protein
MTSLSMGKVILFKGGGPALIPRPLSEHNEPNSLAASRSEKPERYGRGRLARIYTVVGGWNSYMAGILALAI